LGGTAMKKTALILGLIFSLLFLSSCATKDSSKSNNTTPKNGLDSLQTRTIGDYYPFKENVKYVYEGQGNEYASYTVFVDFRTDDRCQLRINNGGTEMVKVLENKDGQLSMLLSRGECYYRENLTRFSADKPEVILKEPLAKGTSWILADNRIRYISGEEVEINTPAGNYKTLEVTTEGENDKVVDYYAPNIGLVKTVFTSGESEISSTLSKVEENVSFAQTVRFYYPNVDGITLNYVDKQLLFRTNDITKIALEKAYKEVPAGSIGRALSPNAKFISLYLNPDNRVYADFNRQFVTEMNAGAGFEGMILQCVTNTLGEYYGVDKVYLTIEGEPYSSGHFMMKKGEAFTVDLQNTAPL
jgi:hypothetical protein